MAIMTILACAPLVFSQAAPEVELWDFYADWCGPCRQMAPIVEQLRHDGIPVRKVNIDHEPELARRFQVQAVPTFVLLVGGRIHGRIVGATSAEELRRLVESGSSPWAVSQKTTPGSRPRSAAEPAGASPASADPLVPVANSQLARSSEAAPTTWAAGASRDQLQLWPVDNPRGQDTTQTLARSTAELLAATVRLRVRDGNGQSCGSGTIVDARDGQALILTCGHIFRESKGKGTIEVDLFGPQPARNLPGTLIWYDLERDLGLLVIQPPGTVTVARIAPPQTRLSKGTPVISVGCNHGQEPTAEFAQVTAVDRYLGPPNFVVSGLPVEGRSGGGLFTEDGLLVGVCNAADPENREGLFAALPTIHGLLDQLELAFVYRDPPRGQRPAGPQLPLPEPAPVPGPLTSAIAAQGHPRGSGNFAAADQPKWPGPEVAAQTQAPNPTGPPAAFLGGGQAPWIQESAATQPPADHLGRLVAADRGAPPASGGSERVSEANPPPGRAGAGPNGGVPSELQASIWTPPPDGASSTPPQPGAANLAAGERLLLQVIRDQVRQGAEVICIVRPRHDPAQDCQVFSLQHVSPAFFAELAAVKQQLPQLTSMNSAAHGEQSQVAGSLNVSGSGGPNSATTTAGGTSIPPSSLTRSGALPGGASANASSRQPRGDAVPGGSSSLQGRRAQSKPPEREVLLEYRSGTTR